MNMNNDTAPKESETKRIYNRNNGIKKLWREILEMGLFLWDIGKTLIFVVAIAFLIRFYLVQPFYVEGQSMEPSFNNGEYLLIDEITYKFRAPQRGEVIVFKPPISTYQNYIKRIIALPEETIKFNGSGGFMVQKDINSQASSLEESYLSHNTPSPGEGSTTLGEREFFVMGDNRTQSSDSRVFGPLNKSNITGKVWFYIKTKPWKILHVFGKEITIPSVSSMGRIKKPSYSIDQETNQRLSLFISSSNDNRTPIKP
jgi:signal peptidase I